MWPDSRYPNSGAWDPFALGFPCTVHPSFAAGSTTIPTASRGYYMRWIGGGLITKIGLHVGTSSGNISVAVFANSGVGRNAVPGARTATSGAVACPTAGYAEVALLAAVTINPGDWAFLSSDNVTATFQNIAASAQDTNLAKGAQYWQATAHPAPSSAGTLTGANGRSFCLVGVA